MDQVHVDAYLTRIGAPSRDAPRATPDTLRDLQLGHLRAVPFENLSIHLGEPITLTEPALLDKLLHRRRGGFCYELNGAFAALLSALGFRVTLLAARVFGKDGAGPPFDHLALRVETGDARAAGEPWLVDVGFGRFSHHPLRLNTPEPQDDPGGVFRITEEEHGELAVWHDGERTYLLEPRPRDLADFEPTCWWHQTSPKSHFTQSLVCTRLTPTGRTTLSGRTLIESGTGGRVERHLTSDDEVLAAYREHFDVVLDRVPEVREASLIVSAGAARGPR
jgi:N-hydroxyarylamine O-acetyltransferase